MRNKVLLIALVFILGCTLLGCNKSAAKKPITTKNRIVQTSPRTNRTPQPNMERVMADRFANIAKQVSGVKAATVVVNRNTGMGAKANTYTAMVGIELTSNMKGSASTRIKKEVADKIKANDKSVTKVLVTTDPNLITRLKDIATGVIKGKPVSSFATEINELAKRIAPTMK
ncbi:MAG: YhcN/YlaJ family sporulation lipoprotein [Methylocystaceae bacterium]